MLCHSESVSTGVENGRDQELSLNCACTWIRAHVRFVGENCENFLSLQKAPRIILDVTRLSEVVSLKSVAEIQTGGFLIWGISMLVPKQFACSCVHCRLIMKEDEGWRWLPHRLSKRQSLPTKTVLFRTTFTRTIKLNLLLLCLCYEHYPIRLLENVKNPDAVLCVTFGALAATPNLAFGRKTT